MKEIKNSLKTTTVVTPLETRLETEKIPRPGTETMAEKSESRKLRLGLFLGGASSEKEISLESARHVYNNLNRENYDVKLIFVDDQNHLWLIDEWQLWKNTSRDIIAALETGQKIFYEDLKTLIDFAFLALHGKFGEDAFPGLFEILRIPSNGASVLGGALSMDKYRQRIVLAAAGIKVPEYVAIESRIWNQESREIIKHLEKKLGYPFMVKPSREGSSTALAKVRERREIEAAFTVAFKYDNLILVEEVLEGVELTTTVYGRGEEIKALPPSECLRVGDFLTAEEKFLPGGAQMITPPRLPESLIKKIQEESIKTFKALNLKVYSRIDSFLIGPNLNHERGSSENVSRERVSHDLLDGKLNLEDYRVVILEPNNPPAMTPSTALWLQAAEAGMNASQFLDEIIRISLREHAEKIGPL